MTKLKSFLKSEAVLLVSFLLATISAFAVKPSAAYIDYIDFRTLALLFCLMAVMAGFGRIGVFDLLAKKLLRLSASTRSLCLILCLLCFFSSTVITNDVALITFVPLSIITLKLCGKEKLTIPLVSLQTVAANLGSILTPIGNPQNLYIFSAFEMSATDFFKTVLPYFILSLALVAISALFIKKEKTDYCCDSAESINIKLCVFYGILFVAALLTVFHVIAYEAVFVLTLVSLLIFDRKAVAKVDFSLLLTFVFLFIFIGNIKNIAPVSDFLKKIVEGNEVAAGIACSQIFSNVPAAILLSGFTSNAAELLIGINLGGLGTLIASMASLISFKYVAKEKVSAAKYLLVFTAVNIAFLAFLVGLRIIIK